jgi:glucosamine--fructose-6-phosphate aminotransferase (isomerizing)
MGMTQPLIEGAYLRDVLDQGDCLRRTAALPLPVNLTGIAERLQGPHPPLVILTGMGSSFHALHPIAIRLSECGIHAVMLETSELIYYWNGLLGKNTVLIAVSQSGRSAEMIRLLELNSGRSTVIGITNDLGSPLAKAASGVALISAGDESSVSCKTYVCSLLMLSRVAEALCSGDPKNLQAEGRSVADAVDGYFRDWRDHVEEAQACLHHIRHIVLAGRGPSLASAGTGGLIIKEAARFPAEGMSAAAFRHGPLEMVSEHLFLLVFQGDSRSTAMNVRLASEVVELGGRAQLVSDESRLPVFRTSPKGETLRPILEILPVQIISLALAARDGREAGAFAHASKITSIE